MSPSAGRLVYAFGDQHYRLIVSNPPYVRVGDPRLELEHCTNLSMLDIRLRGLDALRIIWPRARGYLDSQGCWYLNMPVTKIRCHELLSQGGFETIVSSPDLAGKPRVTWGHVRKGKNDHVRIC
ncbi:MAG: hypothetical protein Ct9H300mP14_05550 [Gammaproteobacteria bacterium]|nr:MAG: hypothetical protein Ct9H300mP14_05550 [Gammaproteobacteria bacterium]